MRGGMFRAGITAGLAVLGLAAAEAQAATLKVTKTGDPVPGACTANDCSLREAVRRANSTAANDRIVLKARTYRLEQEGFDDAAQQGDLDVLAGSGRLEIAGKGRGKTTIEADISERVLEVLAGARLSVKGLAITGGNTTGGGAGLYNTGRTTLREVAVRGNFAGIVGGGLWNAGTGRLEISRSIVAGNDGGGGGGIWAEDEGSVTITRSRVSGNEALDFNGGGIVNQNDSQMRISRSRVSGNKATNGGRGGGIYNQNDARLTISRSSVTGNRAGDDAGGLFHQNDALATIKASTISGNTATDEGGGIFTQNNAALNLTNTTLSGNRASGGGGIFANNYVYIRINFSTIARNVAETTGGAILTDTASNNISRPPPFWLMRGTIVAKNSSPGADNCALDLDGEPSHFDSQGSNLEDENTCFFDLGSDQRNAKAKLRKLAKNGGPTKTHALKPSSDAVNAAKKQGCPGRDQRGVKRPQGRRCDVGAYELRRN